MKDYLLAEACQNSFIIVDLLDRECLSASDIEAIRQNLVREARDDALILLNGIFRADSLSLRMLVLGPDGKFGEFCGNGARSIGCYLYSHYGVCEKFHLTTSFGMLPILKQAEDCYSIKLPKACFQANQKFIRNARHVFRKYGCRYVEVIEPHLVLEKELTDAELFELGSMLNQNRELFPLGINVNVWKRLDANTLFVKTYERGVKRLTKSCGTGSLACAAASRIGGSLDVLTPGGKLQVELGKEGLTLTGSARLVKAAV